MFATVVIGKIEKLVSFAQYKCKRNKFLIILKIKNFNFQYN